MAEVLPATVDQVDAWRSLRRDGILRFPEAFMLTLAEHDASNRTEDIARLNCGGRFMAWEERIPVGMIALNPYSLPSMRHRAGIGPLYVTPDFQGTGVARHLLESVLSYARNAGHWQLELTVNEANTRACGFTSGRDSPDTDACRTP